MSRQMAKVFPDVNKTRVVFQSRAEESFYRKCKKFSRHWQVYYSCNLAGIDKDKGMLDNEIDFVLYHQQHGLIVVEIKGGRIRYEQGKFFSLNRFGELFAIKNPFQQALIWKSRFLTQLKKLRIRVPVCHAICLPAVKEDELPTVSGIEPEIVIGRGKYAELERTLIVIMQKSIPPALATFKDVGTKIDKFLLGATFTSRLYLRDYIDSHDLRLRDLDVIHETLVTPISSSKWLGIEGEAGTGKSMLAVFLARHFSHTGKRVLLLSSNPVQSLTLKKELAGQATVSTFLELATSFGVNLLTPAKNFKDNREDWMQFHAPEQLEEKIKTSKSFYDVLICDEAQDVQPFWWGAFKELLSHNAARFYLFFDRSQGIFGSGGRQEKFEPDEVLPIAGPYFPLVHNYRTTREIAAFSRSFRTGGSILKSHCGRLGYEPKLFVYQDGEDFRHKLAELISYLVKVELIRPEEITILSGREPNSKESLLKDIDTVSDIPLHRFRLRQRKTGMSLAEQPQGSLLLATVQGFKGLETKIGILVNISEYQLPIEHPIMASLFYVACTRAKHMLFVFTKQGDPKVEACQKAAAAIKSSGSLIIDTKSSLHEFVGTVTYYDPLRVGWMSVAGQNLDKSSIMFFPHDVEKAGIAITIGQKLRFTPKNEGYTVVASDLLEVEGTHNQHADA